MSPVRRHFWQVVARVNSSLHLPKKWSLNWFMPAGVNSTEGSQRGTSTSLGRRTQPLVSKKARYFSRSSLVFISEERQLRCGIGATRFCVRDVCPRRLRFRKQLNAPKLRHNTPLRTDGLGDRDRLVWPASV